MQWNIAIFHSMSSVYLLSVKLWLLWAFYTVLKVSLTATKNTYPTWYCILLHFALHKVLLLSALCIASSFFSVVALFTIPSKHHITKCLQPSPWASHPFKKVYIEDKISDVKRYSLKMHSQFYSTALCFGDHQVISNSMKHSVMDCPSSSSSL